MSMVQYAFLKRSVLPDRDALNEHVKNLGFDLIVDPEYVPFEYAAFLGCKLNGKESGFEIYFDKADDILGPDSEYWQEVGDRDCSVSFRWSCSFTECACICIVCAALLKYCDAKVLFDYTGEFASLEELLSTVEETLSLAEE